MSKPTTVILSPATLTVKCLTCKESYTEEDVVVRMESIWDEDPVRFVQYDVAFLDRFALEASIFIEDRLCVAKHCSVFGRCEDGSVFAFPWLVKGKRYWHSKPDSKGIHYATGRPTA